MTTRITPASVFLVLLSTASCIDDLAPDVGPLTTVECSNEDSDSSIEVDFEADLLNGTFTNSPGLCLHCHDPEGANPLGYTTGGLDLTSYSSLRSGGVNSASDIVLDGEPCESVLIQKLGPAPPFGSRMPQDGPPFLDEIATREIADWIAEGANEN